MDIRQLEVSDWEAWKQFRLAALKNAPEAFCSSYEEELNWSDAQFQESLAKNDIFCVFVNGEIIAGVGFYSLNPNKTRHRGVIWGMYTKREYRGKGYAGVLLKEIITHAKMSVFQLHLACTASNVSAMALYKNHGFRIYGTEPKSLKVNQQFLDQHLMVLDLSTISSYQSS